MGWRMLAASMHPPATLRDKLLEQVRATVGGLPSTYWLLWMGVD
jgi:hypothetical protein